MKGSEAAANVAENFNKQQKEQETKTKAIAVVKDDGPYSIILDTCKFTQIQRAAQLYANSKLVPGHFQGDMSSCFVAIQLAIRLQIDPFMLMQNMYVFRGRPGLEGKLVIALIEARGPFAGPIQWKFEGENLDRVCTAFAKHKDTGEICSMPLSWRTVQAEGWDQPKFNKKTGEEIPSKWLTMPELMFRYRSATWLARVYCPNVLMGLQTKDELEDTGESETEVVTVEFTENEKAVQPEQPEHPKKTEEPEKAEENLKNARESGKLDPKPAPAADKSKKTTKRGKNRVVKSEDVVELVSSALRYKLVEDGTTEEIEASVLDLCKKILGTELRSLENMTVGELKKASDEFEKMRNDSPFVDEKSPEIATPEDVEDLFKLCSRYAGCESHEDFWGFCRAVTRNYELGKKNGLPMTVDEYHRVQEELGKHTKGKQGEMIHGSQRI